MVIKRYDNHQEKSCLKLLLLPEKHSADFEILLQVLPQTGLKNVWLLLSKEISDRGTFDSGSFWKHACIWKKLQKPVHWIFGLF